LPVAGAARVTEIGLPGYVHAGSIGRDVSGGKHRIATPHPDPMAALAGDGLCGMYFELLV